MADDSLPPLPTQDHIVSQLGLAGLFLMACELLDFALIQRIRHFVSWGPDPDARWNEVLAKFKGNRRQRSVAWLVEMGALTDDDVGVIERLVKQRNALAHELSGFFFREQTADHGLLMDARAVLERVELWWILNVELPSDPEYDGVDIDPAEIHPGQVILFDLILETLFPAQSAPS